MISSPTPMASRAGVPERRLRPLWEAIDSRQFKAALKLASGLLTKHPDNVYLLALKALVLERTGKADEALVLCQQAKESNPLDDLTLNILQMVYQRLNQLEQATACYEYACSKLPNDQDLLISLFNCYVRQYMYVKQQQTAMKLYKMSGTERFLLWAISSILLQVHSGAHGASLLLPLAEALLKKRVNTHGLHDLEALTLLINVLKQQKKYEDALELLSGKLGGLFSISVDKLQLQGILLMLSKDYSQAAKSFQDVLKTSSDDWAIFLLFLDASLKAAQSNEMCCTDSEDSFASHVDEVDQTLDKALALVRELQETSVQDLRRGPFLAVVEIEKQRMLCKQSTLTEDLLCAQSNVLVSEILDYFKRFGHLMSFSSDVAGSVRCVHDIHRPQLVEELHKASNATVCSQPIKVLRRKISAFQVEEQLRLKLTSSDREIIIHSTEIAKLYLESLELSVGLDAQESMHGEELLTLATNLLIEIFRRTQNIGYLLEAILILEFGLFVRRYSSQYKLMLINLYSLFSAVGPALDWYRTLDVKYILLETVSHCILPYMLGSTRWSDLDGMLRDTIKFHEAHQRESADLTILAYRDCTYSKVVEFVEFKERLERSHQRLVVQIEAAILAIKQKADNLNSAEAVLANLDCGLEALKWSSEQNIASLTFNEDLQIRPWWSPAPDECYVTGSLRELGAHRDWDNINNQEDKSQRESRWRSAVRRRCLIPRIIYLLLKTAKESSETAAVAELNTLVERFVQSAGFQLDNVENCLVQWASAEQLRKEAGVTLVEGFTVAVFWALSHFSANGDKDGGKLITFLIKAMESTVDEVIKGALMDFAGHETSGVKSNRIIRIIKPGPAISDLVYLTSEPIAWVGLYLQTWARRLQPVGKKKKKGGGSFDQTESAADNCTSNNLESLRHASIIFLEKLEAWIKGLIDIPEEQEVCSLLDLLSSVNDTECSSPGMVLAVLDSGMAVATKLALRTSQTPQPWQATTLIRNIVSSQRTGLSGVRDLCLLRLKALRSCKF